MYTIFSEPDIYDHDDLIEKGYAVLKLIIENNNYVYEHYFLNGNLFLNLLGYIEVNSFLEVEKRLCIVENAFREA